MRQKAVSSEAVQVQNPAAAKTQTSQSTYFFLSAAAGRGLSEGTTAQRQPILHIPSEQTHREMRQRVARIRNQSMDTRTSNRTTVKRV
jgi:hypothetical protein